MPSSFLMRHALGIGGLLCAASIGIGTASAETIVAAGHSVSLLTISSIDQVCHSQGAITVNVLEPPRGGFIEVIQTKAYPNFNSLNTRSRCNTIKLPATEIVYQSAGNYLGADSVIVELVTPGGGARRLRIPITVRPVTATLAPAPPPGAETVSAEPGARVAPPVPIHPRKPTVHRKSAVTAAARRRPCDGPCAAPAAKPTDHPRAPAPPKDPMVNT